jgi:ribonuclease BN (tRNA processing enzyme)
MTLSLTVLGSGTSVPAPGRRPSAYLLSAGGESLLMDCGAGAVGSLVDAGETIQHIAGVALSHLHPDHTADLVTLLFALTNPVCPPRQAPLYIWGPAGTAARLQALEQVYGKWIQPPTCEVRVRELAPGDPLCLGTARLTPYEAVHSGDCFSFRVEDQGRALCYSGDTGKCDGLRAAAQGVDLLVAECSVLEGEQLPGHLKASEVGILAASAGCGQVVLTHLYPQVLAQDPLAIVGQHFAGPVKLAEDGMVLQCLPLL